MTQDRCRPVRTFFQTVARSAAVFLCLITGAGAEEVRITTPEIGISLTGRVVSYDGSLLQLETTYGLLTLDYSKALCEGAACPDRESYVPVVRLSGAARMGGVMLPALVEAYGRSVGASSDVSFEDSDHISIRLLSDGPDPLAEFKLRLTSTDEGFADLIAFEADVVMAMREVRSEEALRANQVGLGDVTDPRQARIVGFDALTPVVTPSLDIRSIRLVDLAEAYRGRLVSWSEMGGPDLPITLHLGPSSEGPWQFFLDQVVQSDDIALSDTVIQHATVAELIEAVRTTPGSLAVVPQGEAGNVQPLALSDRCGYTASAQPRTLKTQDYSLTQPLFLYVPDRLQPKIIDDFLVWLRGPEAQLVVRRAGFVDQGAVPIPLDAQGQRFANAIAQAGRGTSLGDLQAMVELLAPLTRLSTSFRFLDGSSRLDATSRSNLLALASAIGDGRYSNQTLYLVGFGNGPALPGAERPSALGRAQAVQLTLLDVLGDMPPDVGLEVVSFGEALPMGCDDTVWGQARNRRVELWVDQR